MVVSSITIEIDRPPETVYGFLMDVKRYVIWQTGLISIEATDGARIGSTLTSTAVVMGKQLEHKIVVTANDGKANFTLKSVRGPLTFESSYHLSPSLKGTRIELVSHIETYVVFRLAEPVLQSMADARFEADLQNLKSLMESEKA